MFSQLTNLAWAYVTLLDPAWDRRDSRFDVLILDISNKA